MTGYTKAKADSLIEKHEKEAERLEKEAKEMDQSETFDKRGSKDLRAQAQRERDKAENQRALKKHWGD